MEEYCRLVKYKLSITSTAHCDNTYNAVAHYKKLQ